MIQKPRCKQKYDTKLVNNQELQAPYIGFNLKGDVKILADRFYDLSSHYS